MICVGFLNFFFLSNSRRRHWDTYCTKWFKLRGHIFNFHFISILSKSVGLSTIGLSIRSRSESFCTNNCYWQIEYMAITLPKLLTKVKEKCSYKPKFLTSTFYSSSSQEQLSQSIKTIWEEDPSILPEFNSKGTWFMGKKFKTGVFLWDRSSLVFL